MRFKHWFFINETGHIVLDKETDIVVLYHGRPTPVRGVTMIDPRFELSNIPQPEGSKSRSPKFVGETDFALPVIGQNGQRAYLSSHRMASLSGDGAITSAPEGYEIPDPNWADKAIFIDRSGSGIDLNSVQ